MPAPHIGISDAGTEYTQQPAPRCRQQDAASTYASLSYVGISNVDIRDGSFNMAAVTCQQQRKGNNMAATTRRHVACLNS